MPEHKVVYSYTIGSNDFHETPYKERRKVDKLHVDFWLPKVTELGKVDCGVKENRVKIQYKDVYLGVVDLPLKVQEGTQKAKFDKKKKKLRISFKVIESVKKSNEIKDNKPIQEVESGQLENEENSEPIKNENQTPKSELIENQETKNSKMPESENTKVDENQKDLEFESFNILPVFSKNQIEKEIWISFQIPDLDESKFDVFFTNDSIMISYKESKNLLKFIFEEKEKALTQNNIVLQINNGFATIKIINFDIMVENVNESEKEMSSQTYNENLEKMTKWENFELKKEEKIKKVSQESKEKKLETIEDKDEDQEEEEEKEEINTQLQKENEGPKQKERNSKKRNLIFLDYETLDLINQIY